MGTFHQNKGELHGITVVVRTSGTELYVGRCDEVRPEGVVLLDADVHQGGQDEGSQEDYLKRAAQFGIWKKFDRLLVPTDKVESIQRLGEI